MSKKLCDENDRMHNHEGTTAFTSPESHIPGENGFLPMPNDMWSFGICVYTFITENLPFYSPIELEMQIKMKNEEPEMKEYFTEDLKDLLSALLQKDPTS